MNNGIYLFEDQSASGKTRLCKAMRMYQAYGEPVASFTYQDLQMGYPTIESVLDSDKYRVIMLDRYDMYEGLGADLIRKCAENSVVLIDCKYNFSVSNTDEICFISMTTDSIEVTS